MNYIRRQFGMTLIEMLVTLAVVLILISATLRLGQYIKTRSSIQLAESMLGVIDNALQVYVDDLGTFPFSTDTVPAVTDGVSDPYTIVELAKDMETLLGVTPGTVTISPNTLLEKDGLGVNQSYASSVGLYWAMSRHADSCSIVASLVASLVAVKDPQTQAVVTAATGGTSFELRRFVDPWGMSLRYQYAPKADSFPRVISAGPDRVFGTQDDIRNK